MKPEDILEDNQNNLVTQSGINPRKGTIYATILNAYLFDELIKKQSSDQKKIRELIKDIEQVIPSLEYLKLFDFFSIDEWLTYKQGREGRILVALLYLRQFPQADAKQILDNLQKQVCSKELQKEIAITLEKLHCI